MDIEIFGKKFPMAYTVAAQSEIAKKFGKIENLEEALSSEDVAEMMKNVSFCASVMVKAAADRERVRCKIMAYPEPEIEEITYDEIMASVYVNDMDEMVDSIVATMREGNETTVEVAPSAKKTKAAQSK